MSKITILHNPRCSKSRQTLQILTDKSLDVDIVEYLKSPLTESELIDLKKKLGVESFIGMMRPKEAEFKEQGLTKDSDESALLKALVDVPKLLERPVVINGDSARIGRPPESVLEIL